MIVEHDERNRALLAYRSMLDALPLPATLLDQDGQVRGWNPAAEQTFGWSAAEVIGQPAPGIPEEEQEAFVEQLQRALQGESVLGLEGRRQTKDGPRSTSGWPQGHSTTLEERSSEPCAPSRT